MADDKKQSQAADEKLSAEDLDQTVGGKRIEDLTLRLHDEKKAKRTQSFRTPS